MNSLLMDILEIREARDLDGSLGSSYSFFLGLASCQDDLAIRAQKYRASADNGFLLSNEANDINVSYLLARMHLSS
jgi:hypothetical protein